ncbi:MAG: redoxin domain-containing protein [Acidimicrobiales bacterium]
MARVRAPELFGRGGWIGASPDLTLSAMAGKIVVLDFWTASCINCMRVVPELRELEERFRAELVVIGIHSPKFPREHEHDAVERAVERLGVRHPVLDDPDLATWQQYGVKGWPTLVLIDPEGYVVGGISGEGSGPVLASSIEALINEHESKGTLVRGAVEGIWGTITTSSAFRTLSYPGKVDADPSGRRLAVSDTGNDRVLITDLQGRVEQVFPLLTRPQGVRFDGARLVVCDTGADRVVAIDRISGEQTTLASGIASPWDLAVLADGTIVVAEAGRHRIWKIPPGPGDAKIVAGTGQENLIDTDSSEPGADPATALLAQPSGIAALPDGGAVFVDAESSALRVLGPDNSVHTLVGQGLFDWGASDGGPESAALQHPVGVAVAPATGGLPIVYVADSFNGMIRSWTGTAWSATDGTLNTLPVTGLEEPGGLVALPDGRLVIADTNHHRIVVVAPEATEATPIVLDESWLGTATGDELETSVGGPVRLPYAFEPGQFSLDTSAGPPVRIEVSAEPGTLLAPGPRRWALTDPNGAVTLAGGTPGEGVLVVELEVSVCDDDLCTVLRARSRHDLKVVAASGASELPAPDTDEWPEASRGDPQ